MCRVLGDEEQRVPNTRQVRRVALRIWGVVTWLERLDQNSARRTAVRAPQPFAGGVTAREEHPIPQRLNPSGVANGDFDALHQDGSRPAAVRLPQPRAASAVVRREEK